MYMPPSKCHDELIGAHKYLVLMYSYSDEVFLLPAMRIPIRIAFYKNSSLKTPEQFKVQFPWLGVSGVVSPGYMYNRYRTC